MPLIGCRHCGAEFRLRKRPSRSTVRCRSCGKAIRIAKRRKQKFGLPHADLIYRVFGAVIFVGTLINLVDGIQTGDGTEPGVGTATSWQQSSDWMLGRILPFFVIGLLGGYAMWNGAPNIPVMARQNRVEGFRDIAVGLCTFIAGIVVSAMTIMVSHQTGFFVIATGMLMGGVILCVKGVVVLVTGWGISSLAACGRGETPIGGHRPPYKMPSASQVTRTRRIPPRFPRSGRITRWTSPT